MSKLLKRLLVCFMMVSLVACGSGDKETNTKDKNEDKEKEVVDNKEYLTGKHNIEISITGYGVIKAELDADVAPITVTNFVELAKSGFYDGLTFHRIITDFMIQGGDPKGNGTGGSDQSIKGEFSSNGVDNNISHVRGVLSMARSQMPDSGSSQFFIVHQDSLFLDGEYAGFGKVIEGMEIVDKICADVQVEDKNGSVAASNQPVIESIKVIE